MAPSPTVHHVFNVRLLADDIARRGWGFVDLAARADVGAQAVGRFLRGEHQTPKMAARFAEALGYDINRYLVKTVVKKGAR